MKRLILFLVFGVISLNCFGELSEVKKINVDFPKFGTYENTTHEKYDGLLKRVETFSNLNGKNIWGKLLSNFFPKGKSTSIYNLNEKIIYTLDLDKETYSKSEIQKYFEDDQYSGYEEEEFEEEQEESEAKYKILRQEFKITDTKEISEINQFNANRYEILYLLERMELETKKVIIDSLFVNIYTSDDLKLFERSEQEKKEFNVAMMEAVGLDVDYEDYDSMLGLNWIKKLQAMDEEAQSGDFDIDYSQFSKIKGYPVLTDGSYYVKEIIPEVKKKKKSGFGGFSSLKKSIMDKAEEAVTKKDTGSYKRMVSYRTETVEINFDDIDNTDFIIPEHFKEIK